MTKKLTILGATGSIGVSTLDVVAVGDIWSTGGDFLLNSGIDGRDALFGRQFPPQIPAGDVVPVDEGVVHILSPRLHTLRPRLCHSPKSMVD